MISGLRLATNPYPCSYSGPRSSFSPSPSVPPDTAYVVAAGDSDILREGAERDEVPMCNTVELHTRVHVDLVAVRDSRNSD